MDTHEPLLLLPSVSRQNGVNPLQLDGGFIHRFGDDELAERLHAAHLLSLPELLSGLIRCHRLSLI
jgi:hypothetical protein